MTIRLATAAALAAGAILLASAGGADARTCRVVDPTGTPLNVRLYASGPVVATLPNGSAVEVVGTRRDNQGRRWYEVDVEDGRSEAVKSQLPPPVVFAAYVEC